MKRILVCAVLVLVLLASAGCAGVDAPSLQEGALAGEAGTALPTRRTRGSLLVGSPVWPMAKPGSAGTALPQSSSATPEEDDGQAEEEAPLPEGFAFGELQNLRDTYPRITPHGAYDLLPIDGDAGLLTYTDFAARQQRLLCNDAACEHRDEACNAWWPSWFGSVTVAGDTLLMEDNSGLWVMELDGANRRLLVEREENQEINTLLFDGEWLLAGLYTTLLEPGPDGIPQYVDYWQEYARIHCKTGEMIDLALPQDIYILGAYGTQLVVWDGLGWEETGHYWLLDPLTEEMTQIAETADVLSLFGEYLVGQRGQQYVDMELYALSLTGEEQWSLLLDDYFNIGGYFDGFLYADEMDGNFNEYPVKIAMETGEKQPATMRSSNSVPGHVQVPVAQHEGMYVVSMGARRYEYETEEFGAYTGWQFLYGLVDRQAFLNGSEEYAMLQWLPMPVE